MPKNYIFYKDDGTITAFLEGLADKDSAGNDINETIVAERYGVLGAGAKNVAVISDSDATKLKNEGIGSYNYNISTGNVVKK